VSSCKEYSTNQGYCDNHQDKIRKKDRERGTSHQRGYDARWNKARIEHLDEHPLCADCAKRDYITPATVVDHIVPHKGNEVLFWDQSNWQSLCKPCHDRKTATEDMGGWSPLQHKPKANLESKNPFQIGQLVVCTNGQIQDKLHCNHQKQWEVLDVIGNTIEITDGCGTKQLHHSHFKRA